MNDEERHPQIAHRQGRPSTSTSTSAHASSSHPIPPPSPSTSFLALAASTDQSPATTFVSLDDCSAAASSSAGSVKTLALPTPVTVLSPHDFSRNIRCSSSAGSSSTTTTATTTTTSRTTNSDPDDPPTPRRATPRHPVPPSPSPSSSSAPNNRRFSHATAPRLSVDTFGGTRTPPDDDGDDKNAHLHKQANSRLSTTRSSEPKRNSLAPPSTMFTPLSSAPVSPSISSHNSNSLRHTTSSTNFKEEAQEYWAQKLSQRQDELATGASTTPSAVQMALSQSYSATTVTSDGSVVFTSTQQHSPEMGSPTFSSSSHSNSFLLRQQQSSRRMAGGGGHDSPMSSLHRSSTDGGMSRDGGSTTSLNSSELSRGSDSRPLLSTHRTTAVTNEQPAPRNIVAATPLQPLPVTLNQLTSEERQALRRRNTKLVKLLGDEVLELHRERAVTGPSSMTIGHSPVKRAFAASRTPAPLWIPDRSVASSGRSAATNSPTAGPRWLPEGGVSRPRHIRTESCAPRVGFVEDRDAATSSDDDDEDDNNGTASMFEHDPYRQRSRSQQDSPPRRRTLSDNKVQQQQRQQDGAHSLSSRSRTPLPDNITPKAAAMLGIAGSVRRPAPVMQQSRQPLHSPSHLQSPSLTPLPDHINPKAAHMLGIRTSEPAATVPRSSLSSSHEDGRGSSSVHSHNTSSTGRSSLDILLSRVADEVPQALRPRVSTRRCSHAGSFVSSSNRDHQQGSDSDDSVAGAEEEEQEIMYTADEQDSDSDGDDDVDVDATTDSLASSTPDFISDASDSSDFLSSSMLSASLEGNTTHDTSRRRDRRRRVEKMSRWLGSVVPAHIIAPDAANDQPAYMPHDLPASRRPGSAATSTSTSKSSRSSSIDSTAVAAANVGLGIGIHKKPKHIKRGSSSGVSGLGSHLKQFM